MKIVWIKDIQVKKKVEQPHMYYYAKSIVQAIFIRVKAFQKVPHFILWCDDYYPIFLYNYQVATRQLLP